MKNKRLWCSFSAIVSTRIYYDVSMAMERCDAMIFTTMSRCDGAITWCDGTKRCYHRSIASYLSASLRRHLSNRDALVRWHLQYTLNKLSMYFFSIFAIGLRYKPKFIWRNGNLLAWQPWEAEEPTPASVDSTFVLDMSDYSQSAAALLEGHLVVCDGMSIIK